MQRHAILIANGRFTPESGLAPLDTPYEDVRQLAKNLSHKSRGFKVRSPLIDQSASIIFDALTDLFTKQVAPDDFVLFYYSGHGLLDGNEFTLAASDTDGANPNRRVPFSHVTQLINKARLKRMVILLDCCQSAAAGDGFERKDLAGLPSALTEDFEELTQVSIEGPNYSANLSDERGIFILAASSRLEPAFGDMKSGLGLFTKYLLRGFKGEAKTQLPNQDDDLFFVTAGSLFDYVASAIKAHENRIQTPKYFARDASSSDIVITPIDLAGEEQEAEFRLWKEATVLENLTPTYILDDKFRFLHWNATFQTLVAEPLGLRRGTHVKTMLKKLENWKTLSGRRP